MPDPYVTNDSTNPNTAGQSVAYKVTAINRAGEGPSCSAVTPTPCVVTPPQDPCVFPGLRVLTDGINDFTLPIVESDPSWDIEYLNIAEPASLGSGKMMFILKMVSLQNPAKNTTWPIVFKAPNGNNYWVRMSDVTTPSNPTGAITFAYGTGTNPTALPNNPGTPADPESNFSADGFIRIVIPRSAIG